MSCDGNTLDYTHTTPYPSHGLDSQITALYGGFWPTDSSWKAIDWESLRKPDHNNILFLFIQQHRSASQPKSWSGSISTSPSSPNTHVSHIYQVYKEVNIDTDRTSERPSTLPSRNTKPGWSMIKAPTTPLSGTITSYSKKSPTITIPWSAWQTQQPLHLV